MPRNIKVRNIKVLIRHVALVLAFAGAWTGLAQVASAQVQPTVTFVSPSPNGVATADENILIHFNAAMDEVTFNAAPNRFHVFGTQSGPIGGTLTFLPGNKRIVFDPSASFLAGETVRVTLSNQILSLREVNLRPGGHVYEFRVATAPAEMDFRPVDGMSVKRYGSEPVRIYGGLGSDFDGDGFTDLALINEDSGDLRMIRNDGDGSGHHTMSEAAEDRALGARPSPGRIADFNHDGIVDVVASNTSGQDVAVLTGLGDGTFSTANVLLADGIPRGLAVIEANGDGFTDILTANFTDGTGNLALLLNDGAGGFLPRIRFDSGIASEWAVDVADMNNDGIQDIVAAGRDSQQVTVLLGDGQGGFTPSATRSTGGLTWRVVCGDVNNDGNMDVTAANGLSANACIALGDGSGGLGPATVVPTAGFSTDTDLGDLDGDGDLEWIVSNFSGRNYFLFENDGAGNFSQIDVWSAIDRPAGVVMTDFDRDQDLDLVLLDEIADYVTFMENQSGLAGVFCYGDGTEAACPCGNVGDPGHGCDNIHGTRGVNLAAAWIAPNGDGTGVAGLVASGFNPAAGVPYVPIRSLGTGGGAVLGDGLACLGNPVVRLPLHIASGGVDDYNLIHPAGSGTYHYQLIYRSQGAFCNPSQFNSSNGLTITWP